MNQASPKVVLIVEDEPQLSEELGASGVVSPIVAAWLPAVVGSMLGALTLLHQEDG